MTAPLRPAWLRPLALALALSLHAGVAAFFAVTPPVREPQGEIVVAVESVAPEEAAGVEATPAPTPEPPAAPSPQPTPTPAEAATPSPEPTTTPEPSPLAEPTPEPTSSPTPTPAPVEAFLPPPSPRPTPKPPLQPAAPARPPAPRLSPTKLRPAPPPRVGAPSRPARARAEGARSGRPGTPAPSSADIASYGVLVSAEVARHKNSAAARSAGEGGTVSLSFTIGAGGRVANYSIVRSSGNPALDAAARAMMAAVAAPPPPGGSFRGQITIRFNAP